MLPGCCCCCWCLHRRRPLAFTFLREEKEEAGPHLIQLVNFGSDNFSNLTPFVTASSPELRICECGFKKEVYRVHFLGRGGGQVTPDTTWQLVNPGIWFFGVSMVHLSILPWVLLQEDTGGGTRLQPNVDQQSWSNKCLSICFGGVRSNLVSCQPVNLLLLTSEVVGCDN